MRSHSTAPSPDLETLRRGMNRAFSDYLVPMQTTPESFRDLLADRGFSFEHSAIAAEDGEVRGFWFVGVDPQRHPGTAYVIATGVVPEARRRGLGRELFDVLRSRLVGEGFRRLRLEVIATNAPAVALYRSSGFRIRRDLAVFGPISTLRPPRSAASGASSRIEVPRALDLVARWGSGTPSWQNDAGSVGRIGDRAGAHAILADGVPVAVVLGLPATGHVLQIAVHPDSRRHGLGTRLVAEWTERCGASRVVNVEVDDGATFGAFRRWYGPPALLQHEMEIELG